MSEIKIGLEEFEKFAEFFYKKTGILFEKSKRYFVDKRLLERIIATESENFRSYFTMLRFQASGAELQLLTNIMTVNETYFFREAHQFDCLVNSMLDEVAAHKKTNQPIRIWSLPCSSGEEPYSIVMNILEKWPRLSDFDIEIFASDIDTSILQTAKQGLYSKRSVQHVPPVMLQKYFTRTSEGLWQIDRDVINSVGFSRVNLSDALDCGAFSDIDVVFCRNLLIYFDDVSRRSAAEMFYRSMSPGGFICLGHSESMSRISDLYRVRKFPDAIVYQKPL